MKTLRPDWFEKPNIRKYRKGDEFKFAKTLIYIFDGYDSEEKGYLYHLKDKPDVRGIFKKTYETSLLI